LRHLDALDEGPHGTSIRDAFGRFASGQRSNTCSIF
jgi:hypothetical protein